MTQYLRIDQDAVDKLEALDNAANGGRGLQCVKSIIANIKRGDIDAARRIREWDGDKTRSYPKIEMQLYYMFGCRGHGMLHCKDWLCENLYKYMIADYNKVSNQT